MNTNNVILRAEFNPKAKTHFIITSCLPFIFSIFGVVLLPIWIPIAFVLSDKWFRSLECILTPKTLQFKKGVLVRTEKTVPLDKITDLGSLQGPIMRHLGIETMTIETAGSTAPGALLSLAGVVEPQTFRDAVLAQKERLSISAESPSDKLTSSAMSPGIPFNDETNALLREIRDSLRNLEHGQTKSS